MLSVIFKTIELILQVRKQVRKYIPMYVIILYNIYEGLSKSSWLMR